MKKNQFQEIKYDLPLGIIATITGLFGAISFIKEWISFGFGKTYLQSVGFKPAWIFYLGMLIGGITLLIEHFKK